MSMIQVVADEENMIFLCLGSNQGDRIKSIHRALERIEQWVGPVLMRSTVYETEPWGMDTTDPFLNQVTRISTRLNPVELLRKIKKIEGKHGRVNYPASGTYLSRSIDIDILFYGNAIINRPELRIPHPLMADRRFVLVPLAEIAEDMRHPVTGNTIRELLEACRDYSKVRKFPADHSDCTKDP